MSAMGVRCEKVLLRLLPASAVAGWALQPLEKELEWESWPTRSGMADRLSGYAFNLYHRSEHKPAMAIGVRGSAARPVLHADVHHATHLQAPQAEVGKARGGRKYRV